MVMEVLIFILVLLASYFSMEFVAWFAHKYVMHGFGWFLHADHHSRNPRQKDSFFEKNDSFFVIFAVPAMLGYIFGSVYAIPLLIAAAIGITLYGATYFMVHDVLFHQRIRIRIRGGAYFRALRRAHGMHHVHYTKEEGECFGLLVFPVKYLKMELKKP
jgi:beta-carotene 3-hydroxylase